MNQMGVPLLLPKIKGRVTSELREEINKNCISGFVAD